MEESSTGSRLLCSELVNVKWKDPAGVDREVTGDLEAISSSEAWLQIDAAIPKATPLKIRYRRGELKGVVRDCRGQEWAFDVRVELDSGSPWSRRRFTPKHLLDPAVLVVDSLMREMKSEIASAWKPRTMRA